MNATLLSSDGAYLDRNTTATTLVENAGADPSPPIRVERIARRCLDDGAICRMILHKFASRSAHQVASLERAFEAGNAPALARRAEALRMVASDLAADALYERAKELQHIAERGALDEAARALVRTRDEIDRCAEAAGELLGQLAADA